jgi:DNA-binding response OmpR family regulator
MSKPLLIVVDDEQDMAEFIGYVGEKVGFRVQIATSGKEFQRLYGDGPTDAIVMDIVMPDMDGNELIQWLAKKDCSASIILISGYGGTYISLTEALGKFQKLNILEPLAKPVSFSVLGSVDN